MNPEQKAALDKIKKLLRMRRGGTPDEIATALRLAQELADKHGIDLSAVDPDQEDRDRPVGHESDVLGARIQWECKYAMLIAEEFFNVTTFVNLAGASWCQGRRQYRYCITFVGTEWDRQIAIYVYRFLVGHFRREWRDKGRRLRNRQAFMYGMWLGLASKLRERQPKNFGVVHVSPGLTRRTAYVTQHFGELEGSDVNPGGDAQTAKYRGYLAGRVTEIRQGVGQPERNVGLLA